jgi:hypothetical protein
MDHVATTIDTYVAIWNELDAARRSEYIHRAWSEAGRYLDPVSQCEGQAGLSELVANMHAQFPGYRIRRASGIDSHHDLVRFGWEFVAPDGTVTVSGIDVGVVAPDGRLEYVIGFFGPLPNEHAVQDALGQAWGGTGG